MRLGKLLLITIICVVFATSISFSSSIEVSDQFDFKLDRQVLIQLYLQQVEVFIQLMIQLI